MTKYVCKICDRSSFDILDIQMCRANHSLLENMKRREQERMSKGLKEMQKKMQEERKQVQVIYI